MITDDGRLIEKSVNVATALYRLDGDRLSTGSYLYEDKALSVLLNNSRFERIPHFLRDIKSEGEGQIV